MRNLVAIKMKFYQKWAVELRQLQFVTLLLQSVLTKNQFLMAGLNKQFPLL